MPKLLRSAWARWMGVPVLGGLLLFGGYIAFIQFNGNFDMVVAGEAYRSNQPTAGEIELYAKEHDIRSIINLRGENTGRAWYDTEIATSQRLGIRHYDFKMSAHVELSQARAPRS